MNAGLLSNSKIVAGYRDRTPGSAARSEAARSVFPSGIVHDARRLLPYPIYVERALGSRKWDVDGNAYVDYHGGHGALILGHCDPQVTQAAQRQLELGTHPAACHDLEVRWGTLVKALVPCAERVRFTSSGTEANLMALRLARACTGKKKLVRLKGHFHGWQDHAAFGVDDHFDGSATPGLLEEIAGNVLLASSDDFEGTRALLESRDDIAAVMLEPTGGSFGVLPLRAGLVHMLREVTAARGILLIFDEVVTGFRVARGGAQAHYGITPDLATFAKILAGGLPGGAVTGPESILERLDFEAAESKGFEKVGHQGTYNANPVCAAMGVACLERVAADDVCERANRNGALLRAALNAVLAEERVPWAVYGEHSGFYFFLNPDGMDIDPRTFDPHEAGFDALKRGGKHPVACKLRLALSIGGVDISGKPGGLTSAVHTDEDIAHTAEALRSAIHMLRSEGELQAGLFSGPGPNHRRPAGPHVTRQR